MPMGSRPRLCSWFVPSNHSRPLWNRPFHWVRGWYAQSPVFLIVSWFGVYDNMNVNMDNKETTIRERRYGSRDGASLVLTTDCIIKSKNDMKKKKVKAFLPMSEDTGSLLNRKIHGLTQPESPALLIVFLNILLFFLDALLFVILITGWLYSPFSSWYSLGCVNIRPFLSPQLYMCRTLLCRRCDKGMMPHGVKSYTPSRSGLSL